MRLLTINRRNMLVGALASSAALVAKRAKALNGAGGYVPFAAAALGPVIQSLSGANITSDAAGQLGYNGTAPTGTDQTSAINTLISNLSANSTGVELIWDAAVGLSGAVLLPSNFTLRAPNRNCGAILRSASNKPMFMNNGITTDSSTGKQNTFGQQDPNNLDGTLPSGWRYRVFNPSFVNNSNIMVQGGTWNMNAANQSATLGTRWFNSTYGTNNHFKFHGITNLVMRDMYLLSPISFFIFILNAQNAEFSNIEVDGTPVTGAGSTQSCDGIHIGGPSSRIRITDFRSHCSDDNIALNADDASDSFINSVFTISSALHGSNWACGGDITDVEIDQHTITTGIERTVPFGCMRILSTVHSVDGILYRNVQGKTSQWCLPIGSYNAGGTDMLISGNGNVGRVTIEDFHVDLTSQSGSQFDSGGVFSLGGNIELLEIRGRKRHNIAAAIPDVYQYNNGTVQEIRLDGDYYDPAGAANHAAQVISLAGTTTRVTARVTTSRDSSLAAVLSPVFSIGSPASVQFAQLQVQADRTTALAFVGTGASVGSLEWFGSFSNAGVGNAPVSNSGTITNLQDTGGIFVPVSSVGYTGTAPTHYNAYSGP